MVSRTEQGQPGEKVKLREDLIAAHSASHQLRSQEETSAATPAAALGDENNWFTQNSLESGWRRNTNASNTPTEKEKESRKKC